MRIALLNDGSEADPKAFPLLAEAVQAHLRMFCAHWNLDGGDVVEVFGSAGAVPDGWVRALVRQKLDVDGALAYHDRDEKGNPIIYAGYGDVPGGELFRGKSGTGDSLLGEIQHEAVETRADLYANQWADLQVVDPRGSGKTFQQVAVEPEDPVQETCGSFTVSGTECDCTNYVLPAYFDPTAPSGTPVDRLGALSGPGQLAPGGYIIGREVVAQDGQLFARGVRLEHSLPMAAWRARKGERPHSRGHRRTRQVLLGTFESAFPAVSGG